LRVGYMHPTVRKTLVKGTIAVLIFSLFMRIDPSDLVRWLEFLVGWYAFLSLYMIWKRSYSYEITENEVKIKSPLKTVTLRSDQIWDVFVSQGFLSRKFGCGSVYIVTRGKVERIWDVKSPHEMAEKIRLMMR